MYSPKSKIIKKIAKEHNINVVDIKLSKKPSKEDFLFLAG
jgi:hypothetical protein